MTHPLTPGVSEEQDQVLLVNWIRRHYPEMADTMHHSPNGGYRHKRTAGRMKLMGTSPGFPDLVFFHPTRNHHGLAIELKTATGRATSSQLEWLDRLAAAGFATVLCQGLEAAQAAVTAYVENE